MRNAKPWPASPSHILNGILECWLWGHFCLCSIRCLACLFCDNKLLSDCTSPCDLTVWTARWWQALCWQEIENSWATIWRTGLNYRANPVEIHIATTANHVFSMLSILLWLFCLRCLLILGLVQYWCWKRMSSNVQKEHSFSSEWLFIDLQVKIFKYQS